MNRNQKIALGCGGAGCLGLIGLALVSGLLYYFVYIPYSRNRDYNYNLSTNRNSNSNDDSELTTNRNTNENDNTDSSSSSSTSADSMTDDDKHKLYHAATMTGDVELVRRVSVKLGLMDDDFTPGEKYMKFLSDHRTWVISNLDFIQSLNSQEKAREYVNEHFPE